LSRQLESPYRPRVSDLSREIQAALKNKRSINDIISLEEASEEMPQGKSRKPKNAPNNWDEDF